jgi:hypothetical protein
VVLLIEACTISVRTECTICMSEGLPLYVLLSACEYMTCFCHVVPEGSLSLTCPSVVDSRLHPHSQIPIIHLTFSSPHLLFQAPHTSIPTTHRHYIHPDPKYPQLSRQHVRRHHQHSQPHPSRVGDPLRHVQVVQVQARCMQSYPQSFYSTKRPQAH